MRAASNAQRKVTGVSFIPAWWSGRGQFLSDWLAPQIDLVKMQLQFGRAGQVHLVHTCGWITRLHKPIGVQMTHWMRMGSQLETRDKGKGFGGLAITKLVERRSCIINVMEVGCLVPSTKFNNLANASHSQLTKIKCHCAVIMLPPQLSMTLVTFLSFSSQPKRRKPHEAHSTDWQEEVSKPRALWVMQFTYCAGWGFGSSLILKHKKIKKCAQLSAYRTQRDEKNNLKDTEYWHNW